MIKAFAEELKEAEVNRQEDDCGCDQKITDVSVLISTFNDGPELIETVRCLLDRNGINEIIIVNDNPEIPITAFDNIFTKGLPKVKVIQNKTRQGIHCNLNKAFEASSCDNLIIYSGHNRISGQNLLKLAAEDKVIQAGSIGMEIDTRFKGFGCHWVNTDGYIDLKWHTECTPKIKQVDGLMGACYAIPRHLWQPFSEHAGQYGFLEGYLSLRYAFLKIPIYVDSSILCRHKYNSKGHNKYALEPWQEWQSRYVVFKIIFSEATFKEIKKKSYENILESKN